MSMGGNDDWLRGPGGRTRARGAGLPLPGRPGPLNAITDVPGVAVGFETIREETPRPGRPLPVRTGVTAILPRPVGDRPRPVYAGVHRFNGNGEMTGCHWIEDSGQFLGPVLITNTHSVGMAHHGAIRWMVDRYPEVYERNFVWILPVVAETYDGLLNDINGQHVTEAHVRAALEGATAGPVAEGSVGGGTGMIAFGFKGGTGTSSRRVTLDGHDYTVGILVQANHGIREWLTVCGRRVGPDLQGGTVDSGPAERGSIIAVVATDLPMAPHQLKRVARRCAIGIGRGGTPGGNNSGDIFLAFSTANEGAMPHELPVRHVIEVVNDEIFDPIYMAVVEAVEEAVLNAMFAGEDTGGTPQDRFFVPGLDTGALVDLLRRQGVPINGG